jgi:hypothetical protein
VTERAWLQAHADSLTAAIAGTTSTKLKKAWQTDLDATRTRLAELATTPGPTVGRWFSDASRWNQLLGAATLKPSAVATAAIAMGVNCEEGYSHPVYQATSSDPLCAVTERRQWLPRAVQYRIPLNAVPASGSDHDLHVIQPDGVTVYEAWNMVLGADGSWIGAIEKVDLAGDGFANGVRAANCSALGGLIRRSDLDAGVIPHALAIALPGSLLKRGFVPPARAEDGDSATSYTGSIPMGSRLALPASTTTQGLTPGGVLLADTLKNRGGFVVDRSSGLTLYAEPGCAGHPLLAGMRQDLPKLRSMLQLVA